MFLVLSRAHRLLATSLSTAARLAFALLLFTSPLALEWNWLEQRAESVWPGFGFSDLRLYASDVFLLLTLACWLLALFVQLRLPRLGPWFLTLPIFGLVALSWVGVETGIDALVTFHASLRFTLLFGLYLFLLNENLAVAWVAVPLALGILVESAVGVAQFVVQGSLGLNVFGELLLDPQITGASIVRLGDARVLRAYGLTVHPNILGGFIAFALVLLLGSYLAARSRWRFSLLLPLALGSVGLLVSFSRAATLGFLGGAALLGLLLIARPRLNAARLLDLALASIVVIGTVALPVLGNQALLAQRVGADNSFANNPGEQRSLDERSALVASTLRILDQRALRGVGNGALPLAMQQLDDQFDKRYNYQPAHIALLDAAAELGVLGGALWLWLLLVPLIALGFKWRELPAAPWLAATAAALLAIGIIGFFDYYPWFSEPGRVWQWSAWGLFAAAYWSAGRPARGHKERGET
jgi:O-antigen ligase